jgi:hypothetical protein
LASVKALSRMNIARLRGLSGVELAVSWRMATQSRIKSLSRRPSMEDFGASHHDADGVPIYSDSFC